MSDLEQDKETAYPGLVELLYGVIFAPTAAFRRMSQEPPLFYGFIVFSGVAVLTSLVKNLVPPEVSNLPPEFADILTKAGPYLGLVSIILAFLGWFVQAGVFQLTAEFMGGTGRATGVLTVLAFADIPRVLIIPLQIISYFAANTLPGRFLGVAGSLGVIIWSAILLVIGLREVQRIPTGKAIAILVIPVGILMGIIVILTAALLGLVYPIAGEIS